MKPLQRFSRSAAASLLALAALAAAASAQQPAKVRLPEATKFTVTDDVLINGQKLPAGSYSLHAIPGKDEWTLIFNKKADQWGSYNYDAKEDALRVKVKPAWRADSQEVLTYEIPQVTGN